jgi:hypothetical protein
MKKYITFCLVALCVVSRLCGMPVGSFDSVSNMVSRSEVIAIVRILRVPSADTIAFGHNPYGVHVEVVLKGKLPKDTDQLALFPIPFERTTPRPVCYLDHQFTLSSSHLVFLRENENPGPAFRNMNVTGSNIPISGYYSHRLIDRLTKQPVEDAVRQIIGDYLAYKEDEVKAIRQKTRMMLGAHEEAPNKSMHVSTNPPPSRRRVHAP